MSDKPSVREYFPQRADESAEEYEYRLFRDFGICAEKPAESREKAKPLGSAVFLLTDPSVELLTSIRDLLEQLVSAVTPTPTIKFAKIETLLGEDPTKLWERLAGARGFSAPDEAAAPKTSPSVDGCGDRTEEERPVAETPEEAPATAATDTPAGIDTSPLVVHKTASLQNAISARDAVFFRIRNLTARPISEFSYEQLAKLGEELGVKQFQVHRCTAELEKVRAAEVSRGEAGMFSNRRRPGARFSHPGGPVAPEAPDAAQ